MANTAELHEELEHIDQEVWVPRGEEVVPAHALLNGHAKVAGTRYAACDTPIIDRLLEIERIEESHHHTALHLLNLFRSGTSKQGYATMQLFSPARGFDHSDYCPLTLFMRATRHLKPAQTYWVRVICGVQRTSYDNASRNADIIKDMLDSVEDKMREQRKTSYHDDVDME